MDMINRFCEWSKREYSERRRIIGLTLGGIVFLVIIPLILALTSSFIDKKANLPELVPEPFNIIIALLLATSGLLLSAWSALAQFRTGKGTPVPVMPTRRLVTTGPYALCRNPMLLGSVIYYLGVSFYLNSPTAAVLTVLFLLCSSAYVKFIEERELEARFGEEYRRYREETPFIVPRLGKRNPKKN